MSRHGRVAMALLVSGLAATATVPKPAWAASIGGRVFSVDSEDDAGDAAPGDGRCAAAGGRCTLRAAIEEANASPGRDRVVLPRGLFDLEIAGGGEDAAATGDLDLTDDVGIEGAGAPVTIIDGRGLDGVFHVLPGVGAEIRRLAITGGLGAMPFAAAGGILNEGRLVLDDVALRGNVAAAHGAGGLLNLGTASVAHADFEANTPDAIVNAGSLSLFGVRLSLNGPGFAVRSDEGGFSMRRSEVIDQTGSGIFCQAGPVLIEGSRIRGTRPGFAIAIASGDVVVRDSIIEANEGGGINNDGSLRVERSTLRGNSRAELRPGPPAADDIGGAGGVAGGATETGVTNASTAQIVDSAILDHRGGGVVNEQGGMTLINVTLSGNSATEGAGGITNFAALQVRSSTITGNRASGGGLAGGLASYDDPIASVRLSNTILAGNSGGAAAPDCFGTLTSEGFNLIGDAAGCDDLATAEGDLVDVDPGLAALADHGGPTATHALLDGSPAIDAGSPAAAGSDPAACPAADQRGAGRPQGMGCDIGAFEVATACGDGRLDGGEACDDGNLAAGDCCSPLCRFEPLIGDCDASGRVDIDDLLHAVAIALGNAPLGGCAAADAEGDGRIAITDLLQAVQAALVGCDSART